MTQTRSKLSRRKRGLARGSGDLFRERQVIVHDGAHVRRFTLRRWHQIAAFALLAAVTGWGVVATSAYVEGEAQVVARDIEINQRVAELDGIKASYRAAFDRLDEFQSVFSDIACEIGQIQTSLLRVAERNAAFDRHGLTPHPMAAAQGAPAACGSDGAATADAAKPAGTSVAVTMDRSPSGDTPRIVGSLRSDEQGEMQARVIQLSQALERLRQAHGDFLRESADIAARRVGDLEKALSRVGVDAAQLAGPLRMAEAGHAEYGTGGPFIPMPKSSANAPGFDPAALFDYRADRLDNLIGALRTLPLAAPLAEYEITSPFGSREDPFNEMMGFHEGVDFGAPVGSPVFATGDGRVTWAGWRDRYGIMVEIDHGHGLVTRYAHLSRALVHVGDKVARGRPIGLLGNTGRSTGPHLHYEVRVNDQATDPMKFITAGRDVLKTE